MREIAANHWKAAIAGFLLCLPSISVYPLLVFNIEPPISPFREILAPTGDGPHLIGSLIALNLIMVLPIIACIINFAPVMRSVRAGYGIAANPANLLLSIGSMLIVMSFIGAFIADQYPCWMGVPNCD